MSEKNLLDIPAWLEQPPDAPVSLPTITRPQRLPLGELTWENFERLCLRLAKLDSIVELCRLYGTRGQNQQGIDIFARTKGAYYVYQCKRVESFSASNVASAVKKFEDGAWFARTSRFFLCMKVDATETKIADEIEKQNDFLRPQGKCLIPWDVETISETLKKQPTIVDDFFGRAWAEAFCGIEVTSRISSRLTLDDAIQYRTRLGNFYVSLFQKHDPGLLEVGGSENKGPSSLQERFEPPDVRISTESHHRAAEHDKENNLSEERMSAELNQSQRALDEPGSSDAGSGQSEPTVRQPIDSFLTIHERIVIVGDPGGGKSTLLRAVVLSVLGRVGEAVLPQIGSRWARLLPVWVPFPFWTKLIESGGESSLENCLERWFGEFGQSGLWSLVRSALKDERLLLVVDGLDEWTTEGAARIGLERLQVFVEQTKTPVILSTRHYGLQRLSPHRHGWTVAKLASLSDEQTNNVCLKWFSLRTGRDERSDDWVKTQAMNFLEQVRSRPDLDRLSRTPLFLLLLLDFNIRGEELPTERFGALNQIVEHLVSEHTAIRRQAASIVGPECELDADEFIGALRMLAYKMHLTGSDTRLSEQVLKATVVDFLTNDDIGLGLEKSEARNLSKRFLEFSHTQAGLLVSDAPGSVRFLHRVFQEFLAGSHLGQLAQADQIATFRTNCLDRRWRDVLLSLSWHLAQPETLETFIRVLDEVPKTVTERLYTRELSVELSLGPFSVAPRIVRIQSKKALDVIQTADWLPTRSRVLDLVLDGIFSNRVPEAAVGRILDWRFQRIHFQENLVNGLADWPNSEDTLEILFRALHTESSLVQWRAGQVLGRKAAGVEEVGDRVVKLLRHTLCPYKRSALLGSLAIGWADQSELPCLVEQAIKSDCDELAIAGLHCASRLRNSIEFGGFSFDSVLALTSSARIGESTNTIWAELLASAVAGLFPSCQEVKKRCLKSVTKDTRGRADPGTPKRDIALRVLLLGYPGDPDVERWISQQLRQKHPFVGFFSLDSYDIYRWIAKCFVDSPTFTDAVENWEPNAIQGPELSILARAARTPIVKRKLLNGMDQSFSHWEANALVELWGTHDDEVHSGLSRAMEGSLKKASELAHLIPKIMDQSKSKALLVRLLKEDVCFNPSLAIRGLSQVSTWEDEGVVELALSRAKSVRGMFADQVRSAVILHFHQHSKVRNFALESLSEPDPPASAVAKAFRNDKIVRQEVGKLLNPLPSVLRAQICRTLARRRPESLSDYRVEHNEEVRHLAAYAYYKSRRPSIGELELGALVADLKDPGPLWERDQRSAFLGLIALNRLDLMKDLKEPIGEAQPLCIRFPYSRQLPTYFRVVAENWEHLLDTLGPEPERRIVHAAEPEYLLASLMPYANLNSKLRQSLMEFVAKGTTEPHFQWANKVRFHLTTGSTKEQIAGLVIEAAGVERTLGGIDDQHQLAMLASQNIWGYSPIRDAFSIELDRKDSRMFFQEDGRLLTLCATWPDCETVSSLYEALEAEFQKPPDERVRMTPGIVWALEYSRAPADRLPAIFARDVTNGAQGFPEDLILRHFGFWVTSRIRRDGKALEAFRQELLSEALAATGQICVARLLNRSGDRSDLFLNWCAQKLEDEARMSAMSFGYDVFARATRSLATTLLNILDGGED